MDDETLAINTADDVSPIGETAFPPDPDFNTLKTVEELVDAYNDMVLRAVDMKIKAIVVKTFRDISAGVQACEQLHKLIKKTREEKKESKMSKSSKKSATSKARSGKVVSKSKGSPVPVKKPAKKTGTGQSARRFDLDARITWIGSGPKKENPFRKGSQRREWTDIVKKCDGKTVRTYLENNGPSATLRHVVENKLAKVG